jgi:radical SAM superfamily enzyme YgiQ (UPF0313 family)
VAVSFTTPHLWRVKELLLRVRGLQDGRADIASSGLWIAGGPHPTADPEGTLRLGFDVVVRGEGEATLLDLLRTAAASLGRGDLRPVSLLASELPLSAVHGIAFLGPSGEAVRTARREPIDLDVFPPFPVPELRARELPPAVTAGAGVTSAGRIRRIGPIEITRGCPFACGFCQTSHLMGTHPRHRSVETIARYAGVIARRKPCDVRVITPNAFSYGSPDGKTLNLPALESLLAAMRETLGSDGRLFFGTFPSEVRPEHVTRDTVDLMKRYADNDYLIIGAQSGSEKVLERCGRGHGVAEIFTAASLVTGAGLKAHVDFIFGLPGETPEELKSTIRVMRELAAMGALVHAHTFLPLPQTRFAKEPPGRVPGRLRPVMKELARTGVLYGTWRQQEVEAERIASHLRDKHFRHPVSE